MMAQDIVERLRARRTWLTANGLPLMEALPDLLALEAADEIEALRARVAELEAPPVWASGGNRGVPGLDPGASDS